MQINVIQKESVGLIFEPNLIKFINLNGKREQNASSDKGEEDSKVAKEGGHEEVT
jgi:hypothetical protein